MLSVGAVEVAATDAGRLRKDGIDGMDGMDGIAILGIFSQLNDLWAMGSAAGLEDEPAAAVDGSGRACCSGAASGGAISSGVDGPCSRSGGGLSP